MLIHGGTMSSGRLSTVSVVAVYWMSWQMSFWWITLPGVVARFLPSLNLVASDWRILRAPWPALMSSASMCMPRTRLSPSVASVWRRISGLVRAKLDGASALAICLT